jgi:hypothetical protein
MGVNVKETDNGMNYTMSLTLKGCDPYAKERAAADAGSTGVLYNFLTDMQKKLLDTAETNSTKWFTRSRSRSVLEDTMKQFISPSVEKVNGEWIPSGKYPPSLRMKVPVYDGRVTMDVTDQFGKPVIVDVDNITQVFPKRVEASVVVAPSVYVSGQGWGVTWRITYAKVSPPQRATAADIFRDEIEQEISGVPAPAVTDDYTHEEQTEQEEISVPFVETPSAPAPVSAAGGKNRRRVAAAV